MPGWRRQGARVALLSLAALMAAGCLGATKANVSVADLASLFPTVERLAVVVYKFEPGSDASPDCEYFEYGRGAFTSLPADESCRVFDFDDRHPGGGPEGPVPGALDQQASTDLADLKAEFARVGLPIEYLNVVLAADGSVGPDSGFSADRCVMYRYQPGWAVLPEDRPGDWVSKGIDANWYQTDTCP